MTMLGLRAIVGLLSGACVANALNISIAASTPTGATRVSPALFSFSIEQDRWPDWVINTTTGATNTFTLNAWNNLKELTGEPPWIRIGANSEDRTDFSPNVKYIETIFPPPTVATPYPESSNDTVGFAFYQLADLLPSGTHVIWGLNLKSFNLTDVYLNTKALIKAFSSEAMNRAGVTLDLIEIGNEADQYAPNYRPSSWNITDYVNQWTTLAYNVTATAHLSNNSYTKFFGCVFANSDFSLSGFSPEGAFANGLLDSLPGSLITAISQHHYSGGPTSASVQEYIAPATIRSNLSEFTNDIADVHARGLQYVVGETNSYYQHGAANISNVAASALWALDYSFYASTLGIERTHYHEGVGYKYNFIQPVTLYYSPVNNAPLNPPAPPHIQPAYYAAIIAGEAIGDSGATEVVEISINSTYIVGYAFYECGTLKRAILSNAQAYLSTTPGNRTSTHLSLEFGGSATAPTHATIKRLAIPYADSTSGLTWGGQTYETSDARISGTLNVTTVPVSEGVDIAETEIVLLTFE